MSHKVCQICGQEKPADAFSKSYPNRCRDCVAEQTRTRRQEKAKINGIKAPVVITDAPLAEVYKDIHKFFNPHYDGE